MRTRLPADFKHGRGNSEHVLLFSLTSFTQVTEILVIFFGALHYKVSIKSLIELQTTWRVKIHQF